MHGLSLLLSRRPHESIPEGTDWQEVQQRAARAEERCGELEKGVRRLTEELHREQLGNNTLRGQLRIAIRANKENSYAYRSGALKAIVDEATPTIPMKVLSAPEAG